MKALGWLTAIIGIFVLGPIWSGYVLSLLWSWFIVSAFHTSQISIPLAIGISLVIGMFTNRGITDSSKDSKSDGLSDSFIRALTFACLYPLLVLIMGAIVHTFV